MTFALLRLLVPIGGGPSLVQSLTTHIGKLLNPESWLRLLVFPFMPLTFLPLVLIPKSIRFGRERRLHLAVYVVAVLGSALFGSNHERLVAPAFLAFYWLIAQLLQETSDYSPRWLVPVTLGLAVLTSLHHEFTRYALPFRSLTMSFSLGSLALVTLSWGWVTWREVAKERRDRWTPIAGRVSLKAAWTESPRIRGYELRSPSSHDSALYWQSPSQTAKSDLHRQNNGCILCPVTGSLIA